MSVNIAAFFDVDNTLIDLKSMFSFLEFLQVSVDELAGPLARHSQHIRKIVNMPGVSRVQVNRFYYRIMDGLQVDQVDRWGGEWYQSVVSGQGIYIENMLERLKHHQEEGHVVVFVSGSFDAVLKPIAHELGVTHILSTSLEAMRGRYTGFLTREPAIGVGKANRIKEFSDDFNIDLSKSYAYGDDISDQDMLACVGNPCLVNPTDRLVKHFIDDLKQSVKVVMG